MRRDTQIGIILGIVILVIIGVFLSTRTDVHEPQISNLVLSTGSNQQHEIEEININDLINKSEKDREKEEAKEISEITTTELMVKEKTAILTPDEKKSKGVDIKPIEKFSKTTKDETTLKGKWEGMPEGSIEMSQIVEEIQFENEQDKNDESQIAEEILSKDNQSLYAEAKKKEISETTSAITIYKVKPNDSLIKIAQEYFGDETKWELIFEANKDKLHDPHSLFVGQELLIPDVTSKKIEKHKLAADEEKKPRNDKIGNAITHTVQPGDTLYRIAGKYYDDPNMWEKILEANADSIENQSMLRKGQILIIPH